MKIASIITSSIDYPGHVSTTIFTIGCNLRCPYCQNKTLVIPSLYPPFLREEYISGELDRRFSFTKFLTITGGEPTLQRDLVSFCRRYSKRGYSIKLDTNGLRPKVLKQVLPYLEYVAMDVKTSLPKYSILGAKRVSSIKESIEILRSSNIDYEFRTTVVPLIVDINDIISIGKLLQGSKKLYLQQFEPSNVLDPKFKEVKPYSPSLLEKFKLLLEDYIEKVEIRV
ncbi:MAG: anaerobic ribonucleoside-triphosphate reductase activating protein [Chloroflexi bacterium]|nr:MAG: anaerobic ribonucleoside-triphosphate reductase activating protein [Chloroflexota bacterium]